jgi:PTH1 family peptidyl-tRNA hydrolase
VKESVYQRGSKSVVSSLGTADFQRVRIGFGRPPAVKIRRRTCWRISPPPNGQRCPPSVEQAADATELLVELGLKPGQNTVHAW